MKGLFRTLRRSERGVGAIEFALIAPVLILLVVGIVQLATLFYAHTGLRNAVSEGARYATIHPRPTATQVTNVILANRKRLHERHFTNPVVTYTDNATTRTYYAEVTMSYRVPLDFLFFDVTPVTLTYTRKAYVPPPGP